MPTMPYRLKTLAVAGWIAGFLAAPAALAGHTGTGVFVNGVELSRAEVAALYRISGQMPARGRYVVWNGCIRHVETGRTACSRAAPGGSAYGGRASGGFGGGYGYADGAGRHGGSGGPWFHRGSDAAGGYSVGGDGSGCIYTPNWSNC
ncbi:MAG: hypothetical protein KJ025_08605 [Burkholderiales bacterium]|nr:hypothetical protein [Burkholderiales bacterium]